tara:strand:+ start:35 stop:166 length:132 start_codon:yes stop_codon:yes gene_type:complete
MLRTLTAALLLVGCGDKEVEDTSEETAEESEALEEEALEEEEE